MLVQQSGEVNAGINKSQHQPQQPKLKRETIDVRRSGKKSHKLTFRDSRREKSKLQEKRHFD